MRNGGITAQFNTRPDEPLSDDLASLPLDEDVDGSQLRAAVAEHARNTPMAALWYGMPYRDSVSPLTGNRFWEEAGPYTVSRRDAQVRHRDVFLEQLGRRADRAGDAVRREPRQPAADRTRQPLRAAAGLSTSPARCALLRSAPERGRTAGLYREPRVTWWLEGAAKGGEWQRSEQLPGAGVARAAPGT